MLKRTDHKLGQAFLCTHHLTYSKHLVWVGIVLFCLFQSPFSASAHQLADSLVQVFEQEPKSKAKIHRMLDKVDELCKARSYRAALDLANYTRRIALSINYEVGRNYSDLHIAILHFWLGNYQQSLDLALQTMLFFEQISDGRGIAKNNLLLAKIYAAQGSFEIGIEYQKQALSLFQEYDDTFNIARSLNNIGVFNFKLNRFEEALSYYSQVEKINIQRKDHHSHAITLSNIGEVYNQQGLPNKALPYFDQAESLAEPINDWLVLAHACNEKARAFTSLKQFDKAEKCLDMARAIAQNAGIRRELLINIEYTAELYTSLKQFEDALYWQKRYTALKDSTFNETKSQQMFNLNIAYETEKKDRQISTLLAENMLQAEHNKSNQLILTFFAIAFLFSLGAGLFWRRLSKERKISNLNLLRHQFEIEQQSEQIQQQSERLSELNEMKTRLFSVISHDIRSPLSQLHGVLSLLENAQLTEEESKTVMKTINENVNYVNCLIENLLFWAKSQMGGLKVRSQSFIINEVIEDTRLLLMLPAEKKKISLNNKSTEPIKVYADKDMVSLILRNLMSNAIKFTPLYGTVCTDIRKEGDKVVICVKDTGVGISPEKATKVFTELVESTIGTANEKGTGLGLQVCREFVKSNGGEIWVESIEGGGSIFCFSLPSPQS